MSHTHTHTGSTRRDLIYTENSERSTEYNLTFFESCYIFFLAQKLLFNGDYVYNIYLSSNYARVLSLQMTSFTYKMHVTCHCRLLQYKLHHTSFDGTKKKQLLLTHIFWESFWTNTTDNVICIFSSKQTGIGKYGST